MRFYPGQALTLKNGEHVKVVEVGVELIRVEKWIGPEDIADEGIIMDSDALPDFSDASSHWDRIGDRMERGEGKKS